MADINPVYKLSGKEQTAKRYYVGKGWLRLNGKTSEEVVNLIGEPQSKEISRTEKYEIWEYEYHPPTGKGNLEDKKTFTVILRDGIVVEAAGPEIKDQKPPVYPDSNPNFKKDFVNP